MGDEGKRDPSTGLSGARGVGITPAITVQITNDATAIDRLGSATDCKTSAAALSCK